LKIQTEIIKVGDDYFIPIPDKILNEIGLSLGDPVDVNINFDEDLIIVKPVMKKEPINRPRENKK